MFIPFWLCLLIFATYLGMVAYIVVDLIGLSVRIWGEEDESDG